MTKKYFQKLLLENPRLTQNSTIILSKNLLLPLTNTLIIEKNH